MTPRSHRAMIAPYARSHSQPLLMAAIRQLETAGVLTPAIARNARERAKGV